METLARALTRDHDRLLASLRTVTDAAQRGAPELTSALTAFLRQFRGHLRVEEDVMFPALERGGREPWLSMIRALGKEHTALRELVGEIEDSFAQGERGGLVGNLLELDAALSLHQAREDALLYPRVEEILGAAGSAAVASHLGPAS